MAEAYEVLLDPDARAAYDRYGLDAEGNLGGVGLDAEDMFAELFGGMRFNMGGAGPQPGRKGGKRKGETSIIEYAVTLEDLYNGKAAHFNVEKGIICPTCQGCVPRSPLDKILVTPRTDLVDDPILSPRTVLNAMAKV